jgi:hypothetical protein
MTPAERAILLSSDRQPPDDGDGNDGGSNG